MRTLFVICERYEVAVIPFPFTEMPVVKRRPAVVISGAAFNQENNSTVVAMITSSTKDVWPSDVSITNLEAAGLEVPCKVRWRLATIPNELIARRLGSIAGTDRLACERELSKLLT